MKDVALAGKSGSMYPENNPAVHDPNPYKLTDQEWKEIAAVQAVQAAWDSKSAEDRLDLSSFAYGARFNFLSGGPGYVGTLYILQGDALTGAAPLVLRRGDDGHLIVC